MEHTKSEIKEGAKKGFLSGILASLCCVGPLVIVLFGLGSISFALSLSRYRPYFLGLGFLFMAGAIVFHLKKENKTCNINCFSIAGLKRERKFLISVALSMGIIYILALYVLVPAVSPIIYGSAVANSQLSSDSATSNSEITGSSIDINSELNELNVRIHGMTCEGCASGVESILQSLNGVIEADVSYNSGAGEIIYDPSIITKEQIINSEAFSIYPAEITSDERLEKPPV